MEVCDILRKSVLKKPDSPSKNKDKRVTFSGTVKLFMDYTESRNHTDAPVKKLLPDCVEINIVDKSSNDPIRKVEDCSEKDFLVHKVIYNEVSGHDIEVDTFAKEADDSSIIFDVSNDEEGLQFVVHKVTEHEDDLIQQELALDSNVSSLEGLEDEVEKKLSELSIENILAHDKIIAFIDQKSLNLASLLKKHMELSEMDSLSLLQKTHEDKIALRVSSPIKDSEMVLSPPLQELGLDKLVNAQSNNLCELDISPLNSIQESDSESDLSSEGTMIMMTSEESEKNDLHIKESLLKYQILLQEKSQKVNLPDTYDVRNDDQNQNIWQSNDIKDSSFFADSRTQVSAAKILDFDLNELKIVSSGENSISVDELSQEYTANTFSSPAKLKTSEPPQFVFESEEESFSGDAKNQIVSRYNSSIYAVNSNCTTEKGTFNQISSESKCESYCEDAKNLNVPDHNSCANTDNSSNYTKQRESFNTPKSVGYWDKSLESVEIPKDVRVWKIRTVDKNSKESFSKKSQPVFPQSLDLPSSNNHDFSGNVVSSVDRQSPRSDELESFVHASTERVQRIRKRYLVKPKGKSGLSSSIRGIRPRFCSTAEILQMLEEKNQPPFIAFSNRNHVSWPYSQSFSNPEYEFLHREQFSQVVACRIEPGEYSLQSSFNAQGSEDSFSSSCDQASVSSCPSVFFGDRRISEGASPPRSLNSDSIESCASDDCPSSVVYYSMKV